MKEMKEKYIKPVTEIVVFEQEDVVTASEQEDMSNITDEPGAQSLEQW